MANDLSLKKCPNCGANVEELIGIEAGMKLALTQAGKSNLPSAACKNCYEGLTGQVSQGMKLRMEEEAKQKNKVMLWKNRVNLIKQGRNLMQHKAYTEAAVSYEKYLRVLEVIYGVKKGELSPDIFNKSKKSKELTIITSVYWDLMRVYDLSPRYKSRMEHASRKLSLFIGFSSIYPDIMRKAESFQRSAKNPSVVKAFLRQSRVNRPKCFIATCVFDSPLALEVQTLRWFRDHQLKKYYLGRQFVYFYYKFSPGLIPLIEGHPRLKSFLRFLLKNIANSMNNG